MLKCARQQARGSLGAAANRAFAASVDRKVAGGRHEAEGKIQGHV